MATNLRRRSRPRFTVLVMVREIGVTALRLVVIRHGVMPASRGGKGKTFLQALAIGLYLLPPGWPVHRVAEVVMGVAVGCSSEQPTGSNEGSADRTAEEALGQATAIIFTPEDQA